MNDTIQVETTPSADRLVATTGPSTAILVELKYRPAVCKSTFCKPVPYVSVRASQLTPEKGFAMVSSGSVKVFLQEPLAKLATEKRALIKIDAAGLFGRKKLRVSGLDPYLA
jgi:hypothetical protein